MKTEKAKEFSLQLLDKFGILRTFKINHYEYTEGRIQLYRSSVGVVIEMVEDVEMRKAQMELIAVFTDIGGFWITEEEHGEA